MMSTLSPGFVEQILNNVLDIKKQHEPADQKVMLPSEMAAFLKSKVSSGFFQETNSKHYPKVYRKRAPSRKVLPFGTNVMLNLDPQLCTSNHSKSKCGMDAEKK